MLPSIMKTLQTWRRIAICGFACVFSLAALSFGQQADKTIRAAEANPPAASSPSPQTPAELFARARKLSDLEAAGIPFHLKATFVASGDTEFTGNGTFEEWWQSKNVWRKEATLGNYKYAAVQNGSQKAASATMAYTPLRVRQVEYLQIFDITPIDKHPKWQLSRTASGAKVLKKLTDQHPCGPRKHLVCTEQYQFAPDGALRSHRYNDLVAEYDNFHPFGTLTFPRQITVSLQGNTVLAIEISALDPLSSEGNDGFDPKSIPNFGVYPDPLLVYPTKADKPVKFHPPDYFKYMMRVKDIHPKSGGTMIVAAVDAAGKVREPYVSISGGLKFDQAAMETVRHYRFTPAARNGKPAVAPRVTMSFDNPKSHWHLW
jgi:TonB family protein